VDVFLTFKILSGPLRGRADPLRAPVFASVVKSEKMEQGDRTLRSKNMQTLDVTRLLTKTEII